MSLIYFYDLWGIDFQSLSLFMFDHPTWLTIKLSLYVYQISIQLLGLNVSLECEVEENCGE